MTSQERKIFLNLLPEEEAKLFTDASFKVDENIDFKNAQSGLAKLLCGTFTMKDGINISPKRIIDMKTIGYVMANPSPQNQQVLYKTAGISAPQSFDVTSNGETIDALLGGIALDETEQEP